MLGEGRDHPELNRQRDRSKRRGPCLDLGHSWEKSQNGGRVVSTCRAGVRPRVLGKLMTFFTQFKKELDWETSILPDLSHEAVHKEGRVYGHVVFVSA